MSLAELQRKLIAAARSNPPGDGVPYAFEKRIMASLKGRVAIDIWALWGRALSRAAVPCVVVMAALAAWSYLPSSGANETLSQDVETALFAAVDNNTATEQPGE